MKVAAAPAIEPRLTICIATYNRAAYIGETLRSILTQCSADVEVVIVDGASPDGTADVVGSFCSASSRVRFFREATNSGIDADYDKAVGYARGEYCWLMTDDDLLLDGAVRRVLEELREVDLVVVNAEVRDRALSRVLHPRLLPVSEDRHFGDGASEALFIQVANYLSFIGGVVVRREWWLQRKRDPYYGTAFVHVGVLFQQPPVSRARVIAQPLIAIRFGNSMWKPRGFEIWMFKWPALIWSFDHFSPAARSAVCAFEPYRNIKRLLWYRAIGGFSLTEYHRFLGSRGSAVSRTAAAIVARLPGSVANFCCALYYIGRVDKGAQLGLYEIARSTHATSLAKRVAAFRHLI